MKKKYAVILIIICLGYLGFQMLKLKFYTHNIETNLGINLPWYYSVMNKKMEFYQGFDSNMKIKLQFSDSGLKDIIQQIEKDKYYDFKHEYYGNDELAWQNSDTLKYWEVRNYLTKKHLTGYWIKKDNHTYEFYNPKFSDIANADIMFSESYMIEATLSKKDNSLDYTFNDY
jgi:hypothetical protein